VSLESSQGPSRTPRHHSLEKTERLDSLRLSRLVEEAAAGSAVDELPDVDLLRQQLGEKVRDCAAMSRAAEELRVELETLRGDFSTQKAEHLVEIRTLKEILVKAHERVAGLEGELTELKQANRQLKTQNLSLQYHLNLWGIPVLSGESTLEDAAREMDQDAGAFFPALTPLAGGTDPIPPVLRGDLVSFYFPNLLHFLANSNLQGVLTVITDGIVSKLYLEKAVLQLAGWNNRDQELRLATLLAESGLVPHETLFDFEERSLYDLELANVLVTESNVAPSVVQEGLREHARVILGYLFQLKRGSLFFQPGHIPRKRHLQFRLPVMDLLLKTAAEMDERGRNGQNGE